MDEWNLSLQKNVSSLDDIAFIMDTLSDIREKVIDHDLALIQFEVRMSVYLLY